MKKIILLSLVLITGNSISIYPQISNRGDIISPEFQRFYDDFKNQKKFDDFVEDNYDGSPYLNKEFEEGRIILSDGNEYSDILLRYNIYNDQFEFSNNDEALALNKDPQFSGFIVGDSEFCYKTYKIIDTPWKGYLLRLVEGSYSLYLKYNMVLREGEEPKPFQEAKKPRFVSQKPNYLIGSEEKGIILIKSLKDFYKAFPELEDITKDFVGREKLKLKSEEDYIELVDFLNSKKD